MTTNPPVGARVQLAEDYNDTFGVCTGRVIAMMSGRDFVERVLVQRPGMTRAEVEHLFRNALAWPTPLPLVVLDPSGVLDLPVEFLIPPADLELIDAGTPDPVASN